MATTTATTVAAVKFADTLDIVGLSPEQIAKFTEKDLAAFTSQQQSELTNSQIKNLTLKQVAALPLKFVEPDTVAGIDPKAVSGLALNTLTVDQFSALTPEQIKGVTPVQFGTLTPAQADVLSDMQAASLSSTQLAAFSPKAVAALIPSTVEAIPKVAISGFTPTNVIGLTTDTIKALTTEQASALTGKQIAVLKVAVVSEMEAEDLAVLTPDALRGFTKSNITGLALDALTPEQFGALTPSQIKVLTIAQLGNLNSEFAPLFGAKVLIAMSANQIAAIPVAIMEALDPLAIKGFSVKNIKGLTTEQLAVLNAEQAAVLTKNQVGSLDSTQVSALNESVITALTPMAFKGFSTTILAQLPAATLAALGESVVATLTPTQISALSTAQAAALTGSQIQLIKPSAFQSMSDASMAKLGADAISSLTTSQFGRLSTTQLEKFTPVQAASFSSDVKTWVTAKKYTLIEGADTVSGGIETTNTIVGSSLAETITAGAGNDIISTGGITGDSIDAGAGNDTITLTASTTLATHTIKGGAGTDTLVFDGVASALTNVSEIENLKLATAASNQTLALGTGANNSFATVDATVLAAGKTLTLTGSVADLAVSVVDGNLDASGYTAALKVTATSGNNNIKTHSGADSIDAGAGSDTIDAGTGLDTMKGGTGADKFVFEAGDSGSPSVGFDTISDFSATDGDVIDFGSTAITIEQTAIALTGGTARISATGLATFDDSDDTLANKIVAVQQAIANTGATVTASSATTITPGESALFLHGTDSYVFISDSVAGIGANDVLIKLAGGGTGGALGITNGDIVSVTGYTTTSFGTAAAGLTASNAVYIADTGANINTALVESSNASPLLGTNALAAYPNAAKIDGIDATDTDAISMAVGQEQALTAAKLSADDTIHIVDTGANIAAKISELVADVAKIDLLDANDNAVSITYDEAVALNAANLTFASDDVVTITGISDSQVAAASALTISDLGGASLVLTGDGTVSLTQAEATGQNVNTQWATSQALTVTADNAGEATISALDKAVLGGSGIKLVASAGVSHAVTLTQAQAKAQATGTSWDSAEAITVTVNTSTTTKIAEAATLSATALGGSSVTLDTGNTNNISLPASVIATQLTNGANWLNDVNLTITSIASGAEAAAQTAYNTTTLGGQTITLDVGVTLTAADLATALAAGQKFTGTLNVTGITDEATALTAFTHANTGASLINLNAADTNWSLSGAELTTALAANQRFLGTLNVTAATETTSLTAFTNALTGATDVVLASSDNGWSVSKSDLTTALAAQVKFAGTETVTVASIADGDRASALSTFTAAATGAGNIVLDSVSTTNAWTVAQASLPASTVKFAASDVLTVTVSTESTASALSTGVLGGTSITLDGDTAVSLTDTEAAAQAANNVTYSSDKTLWKSDDALTITGIDSTEETAATNPYVAYTTAILGGSSVTLTADDGNWDITSGALTTALAANVKFSAGENLTVTVASIDNAAALSNFTTTTTGVTGTGTIILDSATGTDAWAIAFSALPAAGVDFGATDAVTITVPIANEAAAAALTIGTIGGASIVLNADDGAWTVAQGSLPASTVKFANDDVLTVTVATESTASALSTGVLGGTSITLDGDGSVSLTDTEATAQAANNVTYSSDKTLWKSDDALTISGIDDTEKSAAPTAYTTAILGGSSVTLDAGAAGSDGATWSIGSVALTTALGAGVKFMANDDLTVTVASTDNAAALSGFTPTTTGVDTTGTIVLDSETGTDAWAIAYSALPATTNVTFGTNDVVTVTVPNANEAAAALLSTAANGSVTGETVIGGSSIVLNGDNTVSLTATQATDQIALVNTKWHTDDVITVTGIASGDQAAALQNYRKSALGGTSLTLETTVSGGWTVDEDSLQSALAAAGNTTPATVNTGNKLALTTVGALTDKVTITDIIIANETNALTVYDKSLLGVESVVLDAADNSWSVAGATLPTPLAAGIKFASGDTLTVTAIADGTRATALTDFTSAKTGVANIILDSVSTTNAWSIAGSDLTTALAAGIKVDSTDALTVTAISNETTAVTVFTKTLTGASSVVLDATDNTWSIAFGTLDTALLATNGIKFASADKVTVTGLVTTNAVDQAAALAAYTPTKVGASTIVLDSTGGAWSMTESALAQKASGVTFANSDTLTIVDISQTQEAIAVPAAAALKYTATNTGASSVVLDAADNSWSITTAAANLAIADHVSFRSTTAGTITADTLTITGTGANISTLISSHFADLVNLGGMTRTLDIDPNDTATLSVAVAHNAMDNSILFAAGDTVEITMTQANDTLDFTPANANLGAATKVFVFGGDTAASPSTVTAGGVTFVNGGASTGIDAGDTFNAATMDVITGFTTTTDKIDLIAFALAGGASGAGADADFTTTGSLMVDDTYHLVKGAYASTTGIFTYNASGSDTLVVWDGNPAATDVDMVGVVLVGVTAVAGDIVLA